MRYADEAIVWDEGRKLVDLDSADDIVLTGDRPEVIKEYWTVLLEKVKR